MLSRHVASLALALAGLLGASAAGEVPLSRYDQVNVAPSKTSIYVGTVTMTLPKFTRKGGVYESAYTAKVFPFFFQNESGTLQVEMSDDQLRQLERGEPVEFKGRGVRTDGVERRIEGKATPADATSGKLKVRVFISKRTELIFNTTYRFGPPPAPAP
jgi:hypothetical protein